VRTILSSRKKIAAAAVFVGLLTLMVFNNKFRMASWIGIAGTYTEPIFVNYFWDSGSGYNRFEESNLWLGQYADFENKTHSLEIGLVSQAQKLDQSQNVLLKGILLSRQKSQVGKKKLKDFHVIGRNIELKVGNPVKTVAEFSRITLSFVNGNGPAEIYIKVDTQIYKSRLPEPRMIAVLSVKKFVPGPAVNRLELPRIKLYGLKILLQKNDPTCRIEHIAFQNNARRNGSFMTKLIGSGNTITLDEKLLPNSRFHFLLFAIQVMTALFLAWLFHEWLSFIDRLPSRNLGAIFKFVFVDDSRWVFWGIFLSSCVFYFVWLLGLWPGEMNSDTFVMWQQTLTLELNNKFSFVYILILCALKQFYDTPAVAALFQLIVMSFLLAWIFWFAFKQGVPKGCLFFLYLLTLTSVPIAISTIFLNTTTFFALLAAFWGFYLFRLGFLKNGKAAALLKHGLAGLGYPVLLVGFATQPCDCLYSFSSLADFSFENFSDPDISALHELFYPDFPCLPFWLGEAPENPRKNRIPVSQYGFHDSHGHPFHGQ
jgi:hypothetical protein